MRAAAGLVILLVAWGIGLRPAAVGADGRTAQFRSGVSLVEVYVTATDAGGEPVTGLTADDFVVEEDGEPQAIAAFAAGEFPLAAAVGVDRSFSMSGERLANATGAAREFLDALRPADRVMVIAIGSETEVLAPFGSDRDAALRALDGLAPWGTTPLYDAALAAIEAMESAAGRRALLLLSDGSDRYSEADAPDLISAARRRDVLVYPIALGRSRPAVFAELAAVTGGRSFLASRPGDLSKIVASIARELRTQYLLGYSSSRPAPASGSPEWRSIRVTVKRPGVRIRARDGYYAAPVAR